jgi:hypothetical protein
MKAKVSRMACVCMVAFGSSTAFAQSRAEVVDPSTLPGEGLPHVLDFTAQGRYARALQPSKISGLANVGSFELRTRALLGKTVAYCLGFDGEIGGSDRGAVYGITGYPIGIGARWGAANEVSLCGGAGIDEMVGPVPVAARFPAELTFAIALGPIRPVVWIRPSWIAGAEARKHGSSLSFVDELELGAFVRLSRQHKYWSSTSAGGGLAIGVSYRELMGAQFIGLTIGFNLVGAR